MSYEELLTELALADERFIVMTAENRALIRKLPQLMGGRFIDTGITEQTMIGAAAGLALRGRIPVVHALASFLSMRAFEFVRTDAGIPSLPVKLSAFIPGLLSDANGPTHQAIEDVSIMRGIPNVTVFAPADEDDMVKMLPTVWASPQPAYIRVNTRQTAYVHEPFEIGKAEIISQGTDVTILTYGLLFEQALVATEILKAEGLSVGLINMRSLKPVDEQAILAATASKLVVTLEDHFLTGGLYTIVAEVLLKHQKTANVLPFALKEKWFKPALLPAVLEHEGFTGKQVAETILGYQTKHIQPEVAKPEFAE
jgi:transketolase